MRTSPASTSGKVLSCIVAASDQRSRRFVLRAGGWWTVGNGHFWLHTSFESDFTDANTAVAAEREP